MPDPVEVNRIPENLDEGPPHVELEGYHVNAWTPERDGKGRCTQVHFSLEVKEFPARFTLRLKSKRAMDELIRTLSWYRNEVWP